MFLKILLLLTYFLLVFIGSRIVEFYVTSIAGWQCLNSIIPAFLNSIWGGKKPKQQQKQQPQQHKQSSRPQQGISSYQEYYNEEDASSETESRDITKAIKAEDDDEHLDMSCNCPTSTNFSSYNEFQEKLTDTTNVWVVKVQTGKGKDIVNERQWSWMCRKLKRYGIRTGTYKCALDKELCYYNNLRRSSILLGTPKGYGSDMDISLYTDNHAKGDKSLRIYKWIKKKLYAKVKTVYSFSELTETHISGYKNIDLKPSMSFVYKSSGGTPPLLFSSLSVKFSGRIRFYMFKTNEVSNPGNMFAMNPSTIYNYGSKQGEYFTYSCIEFFLRTLHPELNDIFMVSVVLLNMACWLEFFLQKGGPLKRLFCYIWGFAIANVVLVTAWLLLIQLLYIPEMQPFIELCLKSFQKVMFTNIAAVIRQDMIQLSKHLHVVLFGFVGYGILLGYLRYRFRRNAESISYTSFRDLLRYDIEELREMFCSLIGFITPSLRIYRFEESIERILHRLATPDLWLHARNPTEYIHNLPTWTYSCDEPECNHAKKGNALEEDDIATASKEKCTSLLSEDSANVMVDDCVICLDLFKCGDQVRGLPCEHCYHKVCIDSWLIISSEVSHQRCPVCRWPADIQKGKAEFVDFT